MQGGLRMASTSATKRAVVAVLREPLLELGLLGVHGDCLLSRVRIIRSNHLDRELPGGEEGDQDRLHLLQSGRKVLYFLGV